MYVRHLISSIILIPMVTSKHLYTFAFVSRYIEFFNSRFCFGNCHCFIFLFLFCFVFLIAPFKIHKPSLAE